MAKSPKLGLAITPASESTKRFIDFRTELAGDSPESNMMILDTEVGKVIDRCEEYDTKALHGECSKMVLVPQIPHNRKEV